MNYGYDIQRYQDDYGSSFPQKRNTEMIETKLNKEIGVLSLKVIRAEQPEILSDLVGSKLTEVIKICKEYLLLQSEFEFLTPKKFYVNKSKKGEVFEQRILSILGKDIFEMILEQLVSNKQIMQLINEFKQVVKNY